MAGLIAILVLVALTWVLAKISNYVGNAIGKRPWNMVAKILVFVVLIVAPFIDEVIARHQFEALCRRDGVQSADLSRAAGKKVRVEYGPRVDVEGVATPVQESLVSYRDAETGEVLLRHKDYYAAGGWLMRNTWLSMGANRPILFAGNGCGFTARDSRFAAVNISVVK